MAVQRYRLDRLRGMVPARIKQWLFRAITGSGLIRRLALDRNGIVRSGGLRFDCSGGHEGHAAAIRVGLYERAERFMVRQFITGQHDIVELGASLGVISCELARRRQPGSRLVCVEADPGLASRAADNLRLNGFGDFAVEQAAIDYSGRAEIGFGGEASLGGHVEGGQLKVRALTLAELLDRHGIENFDLVMDIEGSEMDLFLNDREALARCRRILIEFDAMDSNGSAEIAHITSLGFVPIYRHESCAAFERAADRA